MASLAMPTRCFVWVVLLLCSTVYGQLSPTFYADSCPQALSIVNSIVEKAIDKEKRMGASLLRLHFHDCFVNGCDASVLLDDTPNFNSEKGAGANRNSLRGFDVIDNIKTELEKVCREVVSCADILAIAARDSVVQLGGPSWEVMLGRRDSRVANKTAVNKDIPSPLMGIFQLLSAFQKQGLFLQDLIALSGAHTIGQAQCFTYRNHIYNESNINHAFAESVQARCPKNKSIAGDSSLSPLDVDSPNVFDNNYFKDLIEQKGLLHSDQALFNPYFAFANAQVELYSIDQTAFFNDFAVSMVNMGNIKPLTGRKGEIRKNCRKPN